MTRLIYWACMITCAMVVPTSCDDDDGPTPTPNAELLLTQVARDGVTTLKLFYDNNRILMRSNTYSDGDLLHYTLYEYGTHGIGEARRYNGDDHSLELKAVFTLDNLDRISKIEYYTSPSDFEEIGALHNLSYDQSGELKGRQFYVIEGVTAQYREEFTYDPAGQRVSKKRIIDPGQPKEYVGFEIAYTPGDKAIPEHWKDMVMLLSVTSLDDNIWEMFNVSWHRQSWDSFAVKGGESRTDANEREFNTDGYLTKQVLTRVNLSSEMPDDVTEVRYEYTE